MKSVYLYKSQCLRFDTYVKFNYKIS